MLSLCDSRDNFLIHHVILKYRKLAWQIFFEDKIKNLIYQNHFFLKKVNTRGKQQSRVILITDKV